MRETTASPASSLERGRRKRNKVGPHGFNQIDPDRGRDAGRYVPSIVAAPRTRGIVVKVIESSGVTPKNNDCMRCVNAAAALTPNDSPAAE